jgi:hypothetical protein
MFHPNNATLSALSEWDKVIRVGARIMALGGACLGSGHTASPRPRP